MNNIITLIFSKNRPLQLDLLLNSFYLNCLQSDSTDIYVVYTCDDQYENSYNQLIKEQKEKERNNITFIYENQFASFKSSFIYNLQNTKYEYVMFLVDDNIFTNKFDLLQIKSLLEHNPDAIGFSLRLGKNTKNCYPLKKEQEIPKDIGYNYIINFSSLFEILDKRFLPEVDFRVFAFDWTKSQLDFNYPLEVSSSIYRVKDIFFLLRDSKYKNPNELEAQLYANLHYFYNKLKLLSYYRSVAFCAPMNKVQNVVLNNRFSNMNMFSEESMLTMYKNGFRIDPVKFEGFISNGCHQEVALYTLEEYEEYGI